MELVSGLDLRVREGCNITGLSVQSHAGVRLTSIDEIPLDVSTTRNQWWMPCQVDRPARSNDRRV